MPITQPVSHPQQASNQASHACPPHSQDTSSVSHGSLLNSLVESNKSLTTQLSAAQDKIIYLEKMLHISAAKESIYLKSIALAQEESLSLSKSVELYEGLLEAIKVSLLEEPRHESKRTLPTDTISIDGISIFRSGHKRKKIAIETTLSSSDSSSAFQETISPFKLD